MPNYNANLNIQLPNEQITAAKNGSYEDIFNVRQEVDNTAAFLRDAKFILIKNTGNVPAEIQLTTEVWDTSATPETNGAVDYENFWLAAGDFMFLPNLKNVTSAADTSAAQGNTTISNKAPSAVNSGNLYADTGVNLGAKVEDSDTTITVADLDYFKVGDLVQIGINDTTATRIEIMRVTAKQSESGSGTLTVDRALYGTSAADGDSQTNASNGAVSGANVHFPFFNEQAQYNKFSTLQTDSSGRLKISNMMGYGRTADQVADGISCIAGKFYSSGYQELGLSGITSNTHTGLAASTTYQFTVAVDGGSAYDLDVTTDASNLNFGGSNGLLEKIQSVFDAQFYTAGNLFEKKITVALVDGDVRFTSGSRLSTSAVALGDSSGGDTDLWGVGRIPALASIEGAVAAKLPEDTIFNNRTGIESPNKDAFFYDDGKGSIRGVASGTIDYERGALDITGPANANLVLSFDYGAAFSGGNEFTATLGNSINAISARSGNPKINTVIEIIGLK